MRRWLRHLPNVISSIRIVLVLPIAVALAQRRFVDTLWLFGAAAASDAVDGFLAKQFGWQSELGGMLDPMADKLMLTTVFVMLALLHLAPLWLTAAVIARDGIIVLGAVVYRVLIGKVEARPSIISKINTLCQVIFVLAVIAERQFSWSPDWATGLGALVFVTVCVSGIDYVLVYGRQAARRARARPVAMRSAGSKPV
jgi:cardiolipin synthase